MMPQQPLIEIMTPMKNTTTVLNNILLHDVAQSEEQDMDLQDE